MPLSLNCGGKEVIVSPELLLNNFESRGCVVVLMSLRIYTVGRAKIYAKAAFAVWGWQRDVNVSAFPLATR
ncbi:MAG: hypothetical protein AAFW75_21935, partial [Cyanobacteria bacterium J06636_16]